MLLACHFLLGLLIVLGTNVIQPYFCTFSKSCLRCHGIWPWIENSFLHASFVYNHTTLKAAVAVLCNFLLQTLHQVVLAHQLFKFFNPARLTIEKVWTLKFKERLWGKPKLRLVASKIPYMDPRFLNIDQCIMLKVQSSSEPAEV